MSSEAPQTEWRDPFVFPTRGSVFPMYLVSHPVVFIFTNQQPCGRKIQVPSTLIRIIKNWKKIQNKEEENEFSKKKKNNNNNNKKTEYL